MITALRRNVLIPFHETVLRRRRVAEYRRRLEQSQWWPREEVEAFQWGELKALLAHAYTDVPYWTDAMNALKMPPDGIVSVEQFRRLPIVDKPEIRAHRSRMTAASYAGRTWRKATAGSTGEPLAFDYTPDSYDWRVAASRRGYGWAGYEEGMRQVSIWGAFTIGQSNPLKDWKEELHRRSYGRVLVNSLRFDDDTMRVCLDVINRHQPVNIVGYTNPLHAFARFIEASGNLRARPRSVISAAEKLHDYQRVDIERAFGCPVFETYGSREFMLIAAECDRKEGLHVSAENLFVEIVKEDGTPAGPGEIGDVVITDLHNYGMPFIRYRIGDMAIATDAACSCGRGLPLVSQIVGRTLDVIRTPDGTRVPGEFFPHLMKEIQAIRQFQVIQRELGSLVVKIVKEPAFTTGDLEMLEREMAKMFAGRLDVSYEFVDAIPLTAAGKLRVTVSELADR